MILIDASEQINKPVIKVQIMFGLRHILSPITENEFLSDYLGQKAIHIKGSPGKFPDLFDWEQINDQINFSRPSRESIRLIFEKQPLEHRELAKLADWMVKGATLVINSVQQIDPLVSKFASSLGKEMNASINVNCYASYPSKQGFDNHYDGHDVFIIQTSGTKHWKVFEPTRKFPLDSDSLPKGDPPDSDPYLECDMAVGDVLYIPRGHWHYALASEPSVHLTVSNAQRSGIDFLVWLTEQLRNNDEFLREDFPVTQIDLLGGDKPSEDFYRHVDRFRSHLKGILDDDSLVESFIHFCMMKNPVPRNYQLPELSLLKDSIEPDTAFTMSDDQKILVRYSEADDGGQLIIRGHVLSLKKVGKPVLELMANCDQNTVIRGRDLLEVNSRASWEDVRAMLVALFENGILEIVPRQ